MLTAQRGHRGQEGEKHYCLCPVRNNAWLGSTRQDKSDFSITIVQMCRMLEQPDWVL